MCWEEIVPKINACEFNYGKPREDRIFERKIGRDTSGNGSMRSKPFYAITRQISKKIHTLIQLDTTNSRKMVFIGEKRPKSKKTKRS